MDNTINYYNINANKFTKETQNLSFIEVQEKFLATLPNSGSILDFGCGAGRDLKYFISKNYSATGLDGSEELCKAARELSGAKVINLSFLDFCDVCRYDGIWACSSILHLPKRDLPIMLTKMRDALKLDGSIYLSFKYGDFEGERNGRYFTDLTEESFKEILIEGLSITELWITSDIRKGREDEKWLNILLKKM